MYLLRSCCCPGSYSRQYIITRVDTCPQRTLCAHSSPCRIGKTSRSINGVVVTWVVATEWRAASTRRGFDSPLMQLVFCPLLRASPLSFCSSIEMNRFPVVENRIAVYHRVSKPIITGAIDTLTSRVPSHLHLSMHADLATTHLSPLHHLSLTYAPKTHRVDVGYHSSRPPSHQQHFHRQDDQLSTPLSISLFALFTYQRPPFTT